MMKERRIAEMRCAFLSAFQPPFPFEEDEKIYKIIFLTMSDGQAIWYDKMRESLEVNSQIYLNDAAGASDGGKNGERYHKNISRMYAGQNLQDSRSSPRRLARNLVDISLNFAKGRFQKRFLSDAQEMLKNPESAYYELVSDQIANVDRKHMVTFGMNLGYNGCTVGAKRIREIEAEQNLNIPWSLSLLLDRERLLINPDSYCRIIEQGRKIGIYVYLFFFMTKTRISVFR